MKSFPVFLVGFIGSSSLYFLMMLKVEHLIIYALILTLTGLLSAFVIKGINGEAFAGAFKLTFSGSIMSSFTGVILHIINLLSLCSPGDITGLSCLVVFIAPMLGILLFPLGIAVGLYLKTKFHYN